MPGLRPFHLAIPVSDLEHARQFYSGKLGCTTGRESERWVDYHFFGHQLVTHLDLSSSAKPVDNPVDGDQVPARHFGIILKPTDWNKLVDKLKISNTKFLIKPKTRFKGKAGEQSTFFILDPSGNALEFKSFKDDSVIFRK